ncbi:GM26406 [Drosophila sechellia]|uniref:GM26406 n=3 Tax=Drosophila sechellia TaxID=7238 RepID=B4IE50_DROSE|nr:GM26406 [Drosophila sechellia]
MSAYEKMPAKAPRRLSPIWFLVITFLLFATTLTALAVIEAGRAQNNEGGESDLIILTRMWNHFKAGVDNDTEIATVERTARDAGNASNPSASASQQSRNFYEEQKAVVVNAESMDSPVLGQRQDAYGPPQSREDSYEQDPYYDVADDYGPGRYPSAESKEESEEEERIYDKEDTGEGRSQQARPYDSFYAPWSYKQQPTLVATHPAAEGNNRKLQAPSAPIRSPYPAYDEMYDYPMGFQPRPHQETAMAKQSQPASDNAVVQIQSESTLVTVLKSLKQIWDLYQALMSAWNAVSERHQQSTEKFRQEQAAKKAEKEQLRQQQQQKTRINSKKPPRMEGNKKNQNKRPTTTTTKATTNKTTTTAAPEVSDEEEEAEEKEQSQKTVEKVETVTTSAPATKVSALKGEKGNLRSVRGLRQRRDAEAEEKADTDVGEGRYIKGDPLKGYYDFVITEGSYKFWAVFQVGTALLIIYSTFAAIYYSKVNPLTSDYDYTDYLGGVRSLSGGDADFVDDGDAATPPVSTTSRIMEWLPRTAHSIQFILDAIDKMPVDHDKDKELGWSTAQKDTPALGMR